jgi:hypothetical protein
MDKMISILFLTLSPPPPHTVIKCRIGLEDGGVADGRNLDFRQLSFHNAYLEPVPSKLKFSNMIVLRKNYVLSLKIFTKCHYL